MNDFDYKYYAYDKRIRKEEWLHAKEYEDTKVICKCGKRLPMPVSKEHMLCTWCGNIVKNTSKARFRYLVIKKLRQID